MGGPDPHLADRRHPDRRAGRWPRPRRAQPRDVYVYFDNDVKVRAPFDAIALAERLGVAPPANPDLPVGRHREVAEQARTDWPGIARTGRGEAQVRRRRR